MDFVHYFSPFDRVGGKGHRVGGKGHAERTQTQPPTQHKGTGHARKDVAASNAPGLHSLFRPGKPRSRAEMGQGGRPMMHTHI